MRHPLDLASAQIQHHRFDLGTDRSMNRCVIGTCRTSGADGRRKRVLAFREESPGSVGQDAG